MGVGCRYPVCPVVIRKYRPVTDRMGDSLCACRWLMSGRAYEVDWAVAGSFRAWWRTGSIQARMAGSLSSVVPRNRARCGRISLGRCTRVWKLTLMA